MLNALGIGLPTVGDGGSAARKRRHNEGDQAHLGLLLCDRLRWYFAMAVL
jgi:hypothetical protein